jgi:hypothetical protein
VTQFVVEPLGKDNYKAVLRLYFVLFVERHEYWIERQAGLTVFLSWNGPVVISGIIYLHSKNTIENAMQIGHRAGM